MTLFKLVRSGKYREGIKITVLFLLSNISYGVGTIAALEVYTDPKNNTLNHAYLWIGLITFCSFIFTAFQNIAHWMFSYEYYDMVRTIPYVLEDIPLPKGMARSNRVQFWFWLGLNALFAIL